MEKKVNQFLTVHVDIFEELLLFLWKNKIKLKDVIIHPDDKFIVDYQIDEQAMIRLECVVDVVEKKIERFNLVYRLFYRNQEQYFLALSFLYRCPSELELCNQYGLYTKDDIGCLEALKEQKKILEYKKQKNLLKDNQFYIFNMNKIEEPCADKELYELLKKVDCILKQWQDL